MTVMNAPEKIIELVDRFDYNIDAYKRGKYNETQVRREYVDPFFKALGWDIDNAQGYSEAYKDVIHEDAIKVGGATKAPDYCFRVGGTRKFFLEAKKPAVNIKDDIHPAYQLRRYAWSAKLPLGILTDFEEFAVYDCRKRPNKNDKAATQRIMYLNYRDYPEQWPRIREIFSKDAVLKGAFDRFTDSTLGKRGTSEVDSEFLREIETWRETLAKNIALRNPDLSVRELNYAVQKIIDRIVFLRICEDRGIESYGQLQEIGGGREIYQQLVKIFMRADEKYNSGLFHFREEKQQSSHPDSLTLHLNLDDKPLKAILSRLYYPECPYEFSVLPAEILGNVYEQFLGKVIRLTDKHQAKVEEKPEVRKAGGVYYTPQYIVDYIVKQTVGKLCESKSPRQIEKLRALDPACGSGSFLLGAYRYLLEYHRDYYEREVQEKGFQKRHQKQIYKGRSGQWLLTTAEKKRILLNNIYGVDIDAQAVEVTKLSLLLKVLENENQDTLAAQLSLWQERALPDLGSNIKCGNSLVGSDYYRQTQLDLFDEETRYRVNAFDWPQEFPEILAAGGFDAVIGNPPYVRQEMLGDFKGYFQSGYQVYHGVADLYVYFIEQGVKLLKPGGQFGYIVANKWLRANYGEPLRRWMKLQRIEEILDFGDLPVFQSATTYPCILRLSRESARKTFPAVQVKSLEFDNLERHLADQHYTVDQEKLEASGWSLVDERVRLLLEKIQSKGVPLGEYVQNKIYYGIKTGLNKAFVIDPGTRQRLIDEDPRSEKLIKPFLAGKDIKRYTTPDANKYLIFIPNGWTNSQSQGNQDKWRWLKNNYPSIANHLAPFATDAQKRWDKGEYWWELRPCEYYEEFEKPKLMLPDISKECNFALDKKGGIYCLNTVYIIVNGEEYLASLLNSKMMTFYFKHIASTYRGGYLRFFIQYLIHAPVCVNGNSDPKIALTNMVNNLLELRKRHQTSSLPDDKSQIARQISALDRQIDQAVYRLYDLTDEEIAVVEAQ